MQYNKPLTLLTVLFFLQSAAWSQPDGPPPPLPTHEEILRMSLEEIERLTQAIKLNPNDGRAYYQRGNHYLIIGDYGKAVADMTMLLRINPNFYFDDDILDLLSSYSFELAARQGTKMVRIEAGSFIMGSSNNEPERIYYEGPQHQVRVNTFYIGKFQVTQKEYQEITGKNPSSFKGDNLPVENVSWYDAIEYCNALSRRDGLTPAYTIDKTRYDPNNKSERDNVWGNLPVIDVLDNVRWLVTWNRDADGYRLPTEAEWEYCCRAGTTTPFSTGNNITTSRANYYGDYPYNNNTKGVFRDRTTGIGSFSFAPNPWGLYDMHGNVWEWCWDWFGNYTNGVQTNPTGASSGEYRIARGGSYISAASQLRSAARFYKIPSLTDTMGFRIARSGN
jgi:formylglycine-generating enzyme required for sulfatase activity